jgi:hypothetical protein
MTSGDALTRQLGRALPLLLACSLVACGEQPAAHEAASAAPGPPRATLVLEPPLIGLGQVGELELVIVTPPEHTPRPWIPPMELEGAWILGSQTLPVEKTQSRWIHRTRVRLRARATGGFLWPAGSLPIDTPDGSSTSVAWDELTIEVPSLIPDYPGRTTPFGARSASRVSGAIPFWGPAAAGSLFTLAGVGLVALARRRRQASAEPQPKAPRPEQPWQPALTALDSAAALAAEHPFDAAHATGLAMRRYMERRYGAPAAGRTTEELRDSKPPFAATSRWPSFLSILAGLDAFRFCSATEPSAADLASARASELLERARRFVEDSVPPGQPR